MFALDKLNSNMKEEQNEQSRANNEPVLPRIRQGPDRQYVALICAGLALATLFAYEPIRYNTFVEHDDDVYVTENPHINGGITAESVVWALTNPHASMWHPLTSLSHMLDCQLFGLNPFWHHLTNLFFHVANALLLFLILKSITAAVWPSLFVAAVFALHPLNVESVAWAAERKNVLSGLFWMLTIAVYIWYAQWPHMRRYLLVILVFGLCIMTKPTVVTLPFVLLLLDYWPLDRWQRESQDNGTDSPQSIRRSGIYQRFSARRLIIEKVPLFLLAAFLSIVTFVFQKAGGVVAATEHMPLGIRISNALVSYLTYIGKVVYPSRLAVLYLHPREYPPLWLPILCFIILIGISLIIYKLGRAYLAIGWLWYIGTLVPVIGLVQAGNQSRADRYTYLPAIGLLIMASWGIAELLRRWRYRSLGLSISACLLLVVLSMCTRRQVQYWQNDLTLFGHAAKVTKNNYVMLNNYGESLLKRGQPDEAIEQFRETLCVHPEYHMAHNNLGVACAVKGKMDQAIEHYTTALRLEPENVEIYNNIGKALFSQGKFEQALQYFTKAVQINPRYADVHCNLGVVLHKLGRINEAIKHYEEALRLQPDFPAARKNWEKAVAVRSRHLIQKQSEAGE